MRFHDISMEGEYKAQTVVDASALVYSASDERRIVYDQATKSLWMADSSDWKSAVKYGDIPQGMEMWIYADAAPTGWTLVVGPSDELLAVKGGSTYITGGTAAGDFTTPAHNHNMNSHIHAATGAALANPGSAGQEAGDSGNDAAYQTHTHSLSISVGIPSPESTSTNGTSTSYRPLSRVGIICSKD